MSLNEYNDYINIKLRCPMQSTEVGLFKLNIHGNEFNFLPSFKNMATLASSKRILHMYEMIHSPKVPAWVRLDIAREILLACSDSKNIDKYLIKTRNMKPHLNSRCISINDQIVVAAALMRHGVAGVNRPDYEGSKKSTGKQITEFDVNRVVADAMVHFNLSETDAMDLTMSKFCYLLASKFPVEGAKQEVPSLEAHKEAMKKLMEKNK